MVKLKILIINTGILPVPPKEGGAIEYHTYNLANNLADLGHEVYYVTDVTSDAKFHSNVMLHKVHAPSLLNQLIKQGNFIKVRISYATGGFLAFIATLKALNSSSGFDIIHGHGNISSALTAIFKTCPFVFTVHNPTPKMLTSNSWIKQRAREMNFNILDLKICNYAKRVIAVSSKLKEELMKMHGVPHKKVIVIPNGVNVNDFKTNIPNSGSIREKYNLSFEYALFVGRLVEQKGVEYLIRAVAGTGYHVVIVGGGPLLSYLFELSKKIGTQKQVHFIGNISFEDLKKIYAEASLFVLPSLGEGLPLVILEAMASGLPIIGTNVSGIPEAVFDNYNGFIVKLRDIRMLRERMARIFEDNKLRETMSKNSRQIAEEKFNWQRIARRTYKVYEDILEEIT